MLFNTGLELLTNSIRTKKFFVSESSTNFKLCVVLVLFFLIQFPVVGQKKAYFADGYHGGIYGHYPYWKTNFIVEKLLENNFWKINLEIEPETWDSVKIKDPQGYLKIQNAFLNSDFGKRIEIVNPTYAQPYCFNISGESIIRQFQFGIKKTHEHFPSVQFLTYSAEEPCFTSCLPTILKSLGFKYAVLKNPDTGWGGYMRGFDAELMNWVGPDGSSMLTSPRYACEFLKPNSTWQTMAWNNSAEYLDTCYKYGIREPVGMCYQDAGWRNGPWLGDPQKSERPFEYILWTDYFKSKQSVGLYPTYKVSQEDVLVSLVWGSQVLQRLAQQVRVSENKIIQAEKIATINYLSNVSEWPGKRLNEAWRTLLLSQHHDCWIVPYNHHYGHTWAEKVEQWTNAANNICDSIISSAFKCNSNPNKSVKVFNTTGKNRKGLVRLILSQEKYNKNFCITDEFGNVIIPQVKKEENNSSELFFVAEAPAFGYKLYNLKEYEAKSASQPISKELSNECVLMETDLYKITIDPSKGGAITSLITKENNLNYINTSHKTGFNSLSGNFYKDGGFHNSIENRAKISIIENGSTYSKIKIESTINKQKYIQYLSLVQGQKIIECQLFIEWKDNPRIGAYDQTNYKAEDLAKAFYNDSCKLLLRFPANFKSEKIFKNAPFDVCESKLKNTFFNTWDSIKNNIILNWVDVYDSLQDVGFAVFSDHTTSYSHGQKFPLSLTVQYSGKGLWGRSYGLNGNTQINYSLFPHSGDWRKADVSDENNHWNEPLLASYVDEDTLKHFSFVDLNSSCLEATALYIENNDMILRLFNSGEKLVSHAIYVAVPFEIAEQIELNNNVTAVLFKKVEEGKVSVEVDISQYGVRTLRFKNIKKLIN